jgi:glycosyltransferase involved in cell wall biosynthesis
VIPLQGTGIVGYLREYIHLRVLRRLYAFSDLAIFTVPLDMITWLPSQRDKAVFIQVGANYPAATSALHGDDPRGVKTVAVYSITGGDRTSIEVADIGAAVRRATSAVGPTRLILFGRGSQEAEPALRSELAGVDVAIESLGLLPPIAVSQALSRADVLLFVRGQISSRRGSAIAGIAAGLPILCYSGPETAWPITEAGISAVPQGDRGALAIALETMLTDDAFRRTLAGRSRAAHEKYFSWAAITAQFAAAVRVDSNAQAVGLGKSPSDSRRVA